MPFKPDQVPFQPARPDEPGEQFVDVLDRHAGRDRRLRERMLVFLQQWDHLADEHGREPRPDEYAGRWGVSLPSVYRLLNEFQMLFPSEQTPGRLLGVLWDGLGPPYWTREELGSLLEVRVVELGSTSGTGAH